MDYELLQRYIEGNATIDEAEQVVDWLDADPAHVDEFIALHKIYDILVMNPAIDSGIDERKKSKINISAFIYEVIKIAAVALVIIGIQYIVDYTKSGKNISPLYQTLYVPAGQRAELLLPDSTKIWLNACSKLIYPTSFQKDSRWVELEGEAYFEVKRDEHAPFVVRTAKMDIKVLGTEFNVLAYPQKECYEVALLKGSVKMQSADQNLLYQMTPGELVRYEKGKYVAARIKELDYFKWKEGLISFYNQPISEILDKLSLYFDVKIKVLNKQFLKEHYTGKFRVKDGVEQVLKVLQREHRFSYEKDNEQNIITIK